MTELHNRDFGCGGHVLCCGWVAVWVDGWAVAAWQGPQGATCAAIRLSDARLTRRCTRTPTRLFLMLSTPASPTGPPLRTNHSSHIPFCAFLPCGSEPHDRRVLTLLRFPCCSCAIPNTRFPHPPDTFVPQTRLSEEFERCSSYLDASSRRPLIAAVESELVGRHVGALLDGRRGLGPLLEGHRVADLGRLHGLVGRVGAGEALRAALREHLRAAGLALVKDEEKVG